ncbi:hypothetical protein ASE52_07370 [Acidovorax sp. Root275]|nr:hypothetical protein ASE52_07370 [Acidovorax sp. Root275]
MNSGKPSRPLTLSPAPAIPNTQRLPSRAFGHPEDVDLFVIVAVFQLGFDVGRVGVAVEVFVGVGEAGRQLGAAGGKGVREVFAKMRPSTSCLYSAASMLARSLSAVAQRVFLISPSM